MEEEAKGLELELGGAGGELGTWKFCLRPSKGAESSRCLSPLPRTPEQGVGNKGLGGAGWADPFWAWPQS